jgi:hypothetical protein
MYMGMIPPTLLSVRSALLWLSMTVVQSEVCDTALEPSWPAWTALKGHVLLRE